MNVLLNKMLSKACPAEVPGLSRFFKTGPGQYGEGDKFLGIKVPVTRAVVKECWKETSFQDLEECISSPYHEVRLAALLTLVEIFRHAGKRPPITSGVTEKQCIDFYLSHTDRINNWDLVDLSCYPLLGQWLLDKDRTLLYDLARRGRTIWEQRIGIVSTMTFIRNGKLEDTFRIADILLHHPHDLIHKAVGWLLREAGKRDKPALEAWLQGTPDQVGGDGDNRASRYSTMPRTMLRYAIEKFTPQERARYLSGKKSIEVVAAIIIRDGKVFATQRGYGPWKDWWEFPGGKREEGESPEEALRREIKEELDAEIIVHKLLKTIEWDYPEFHLTMHCYLCTPGSARMHLNEHEAARWLTQETLRTVKWLPADNQLLPLIEAELPKKLYICKNK